VSLEVMIRGTCDRARLLDLVQNFTLFSERKAELVQIIGENQQFLGVKNAIASMREGKTKKSSMSCCTRRQRNVAPALVARGIRLDISPLHG
jgi:type I site-specific restriction-modification system R (restriction) subunit